MSSKQWWLKYRVPAASVQAFLERYYKPDRYHAWGEKYAAALLASHEADFARDGYDIISHHDSVTGTVVCYCPDREEAADAS